MEPDPDRRVPAIPTYVDSPFLEFLFLIFFEKNRTELAHLIDLNREIVGWTFRFAPLDVWSNQCESARSVVPKAEKSLAAAAYDR